MALRIIHTADWHLGHSLHGLARDFEHRRFLDWLLDILEQRQADALLIAGDVFDSSNPPASAQAVLYRFVVEAGRRLPRLRVVIVAGNHDSAARLEAPSPILDALNVHVVGSPRRRSDGRLDLEPLIAPLPDASGRVAAWCAAVPYLRPSDLRADAPGDGGGDRAGDQDPLVAGVAALYGEVIGAISARREADQAIVAMGHCYMVGTRLSELSERRILGGNQHALPAGLFADGIAYAALGHLHLAQAVGKRERVRYSGSPIPLSLDERAYPHQVVQVDLEGAHPAAIEPVAVPRFVDIHRFPGRGSADVETVESALAGFPFDPDLPPERHPYLEVVVRLDRPDPGLRARIESALEGRPARLLKLRAEYPGRAGALAAETPGQRLGELVPEGVFRERYRQQHQAEPPEELMAAFHELVEQVQEAES